MLRVVVGAEAAHADLVEGLDEIVREGARRMLAAALEAEVAAYVPGSPARSMSEVDGWWCATAMPGRGR